MDRPVIDWTAVKSVCIVGAGVAGLQAIATTRRLGAIVSAFDVRAAAKQEVESLGATFIEVPSEESGDAGGGYAREMSEAYMQKASALIHETLKKNDIAITTALIPGRRAPLLITEAMVKDMKPGSVIVDMAVESGGNCELSKRDETVEAYGVTILGRANLPAVQAADTSTLYGRNLLNVLALMLDAETGELAIDWEDEDYWEEEDEPNDPGGTRSRASSDEEERVPPDNSHDE